MHGEWVPIIFFISIAMGVWGYLLFNYKAKEQQQNTLKKLIDNGQALSPELIASIAKPQKSDTSKDFSRGVLLIAFSLALGLFGYLDDNMDVTRAGLFPLFLGAAFLLIWKFKPNNEN